MRLAVVFGTRPEAIKCAPVIRALRERGHEVVVISTGQHREMLAQALELFTIKPDYELTVMQTNQTLEQVAARVLEQLPPVLKQARPRLVLVQGDTATAFFGGLSAFYQQIPVGHIEAGLRTGDKYNPFPEEINRRLITQLADLHFAPTTAGRDNLLRDGVTAKSIFVTGNTVIDALQWVSARVKRFAEPALANFDPTKRTILLTTHRRENLGADMGQIFAAIKRLLAEFADVQVLFPVHLNPVIQQHVRSELGHTPRLLLSPPLNYADLVLALKFATLVLTDSGGIQEEAPALGKPVFVLRKTTERPEGIAAGTAQLVGTETEAIYQAARKLLTSPAAYNAMAQAVNPYGDGTAAAQITGIIEQYVQSA